MKNYCYFMFKPGYTDEFTVNSVKNDLKKMNISIEKEALLMLNEEILREHYAHIVDRKDRVTGKPIFPFLQEYMTSGPVLAWVLSGEGEIIEPLREKVGATANPADGTWRREFRRFPEDVSITKNGFHCSDSSENALEEIARFFEKGESFGIKVLF